MAEKKKYSFVIKRTQYVRINVIQTSNAKAKAEALVRAEAVPFSDGTNKIGEMSKADMVFDECEVVD